MSDEKKYVTPEWVEDWNKDLAEQPDEEDLERLYLRYCEIGDPIVQELSGAEIVQLLRALRVNHRRDVIDRGRRAGIIE